LVSFITTTEQLRMVHGRATLRASSWSRTPRATMAQANPRIVPLQDYAASSTAYSRHADVAGCIGG
jgi:hypothetical protein